MTAKYEVCVLTNYKDRVLVTVAIDRLVDTMAINEDLKLELEKCCFILRI